MLYGTLFDSGNKVGEEGSHVFLPRFLSFLFLQSQFLFLFALLLPNFGKHNGFNCTVYVLIIKLTLTEQFFQCLVDGAHLTINNLPAFSTVELLQACSILICPLPHIAVNHNSGIDILVDFRNAFSYSNE